MWIDLHFENKRKIKNLSDIDVALLPCP
jgi:hypothetical protein